MRDKLDPADGVKGRGRKRTEGSEGKDKKTDSGNRVEEKGADAEKKERRQTQTFHGGP